MRLHGSATTGALAALLAAAVTILGLQPAARAVQAAPAAALGSAQSSADSPAGEPVATGGCVTVPARSGKPEGRPCVTLRLGKKKHARVEAGDTIVLKGKVRDDRARATVLIQELKGGGRFGSPRKTKGKWKTVDRVSHDGAFTVRRTVSWGHHVFRAKVRLGADRARRAGLPAAAPGATDTAATSPTTTSTAGSYGYGYVFANDTGKNLQLTYTGGAGSDTKSETVPFDDKTIALSLLRNPPQDYASGFTLEGKTAGITSTYKYDGSSGKSPCAAAKQPTMGPGDVAVVVFQNQTFGYKGTIEWPDKSTCTFAMLTSFEDFFKKQGPWAIVLEVAAAVLIVAIIVAVTIVTGGADLPELGEAAAGVADSVEVGTDVVEGAGEVAEEVSQALEEELPNITAEDGWPPKYLADFIDELGGKWRIITFVP